MSRPALDLAPSRTGRACICREHAADLGPRQQLYELIGDGIADDVVVQHTELLTDLQQDFAIESDGADHGGPFFGPGVSDLNAPMIDHHCKRDDDDGHVRDKPYQERSFPHRPDRCEVSVD
jgi:hypothetical protein